MKRKALVVMLVAGGLFLGVASKGKAQYEPVGEDGIAASPKLRQQLNERQAAPVFQGGGEAMVYESTRQGAVAASPKVSEMLAEQNPTMHPAAEVEPRIVGYRPVGNDGIAASPKLREQLNEREAAVQIAPVQ